MLAVITLLFTVNVLCTRCSTVRCTDEVQSHCFWCQSFLNCILPIHCFTRNLIKTWVQQTHSPPHFPFLLRLCNLFHRKVEDSPGNWSLLGMSYCSWDFGVLCICKRNSRGFLEYQQWRVIYRVVLQYTQWFSLRNIPLGQWLGLSESWARWSGWSETKVSWEIAPGILHVIGNSLLCAGVQSGLSHPYQDTCRMIFISLYAYKGV